MKVLWVSDGVTPTGFARVAHNLIKRAPDDVEVHHLAINYFGDPHKFNHKIYPAYPGGDVYGLGRLPKLYEAIKPDVIFLFNDINIISQYLARLRGANIKSPVYVYYPVDSKNIDRDYFQLFDFYVKKLFVYTEFGKEETLKAYSKLDPIVIPHGNDNNFYKLDNKEEVKKKITGDDEVFVVLNANRNQPRKRIDITIKAFAEFARDKDDVRLYLHMGIIDAGWNIIKLSQRYGIEDKLIITNKSVGTQRVPDEVLNAIYNTADVSINTSEGEGWGLVSTETAALGIPNIVPNYAATGELFKNTGIVIDPITTKIAPGTLAEFCVLDPSDVAKALDKLYYDKEYYNKVSKLTEEEFSSDKYSWDNIAKKFWEEFVK